MTENQRLLITQQKVQEEIIEYLESCPHDIDELIDLEKIDEISMAIAEGIRDDIADQRMEEARDERDEDL